MELKDVVVKVPSHVDAFGQELADFLLAVDKAMEDGWQITEDLPPIISAAIADLVPAMKEFKDAQADLTADVYDSVKGILIHIVDVVQAFATKAV